MNKKEAKKSLIERNEDIYKHGGTLKYVERFKGV